MSSLVTIDVTCDCALPNCRATCREGDSATHINYRYALNLLKERGWRFGPMNFSRCPECLGKSKERGMLE